MREFFDANGKRVDLVAVYSNPQVGQTLVLDCVHLPEKSPYAKYPQPSIFTVIEKSEENGELYCVIQDESGQQIREVLVQRNSEGYVIGSIFGYLYPVQNWIAYIRLRDAHQKKNSQEVLDRLRSQVAILQDTLRGVHVKVTIVQEGGVVPVEVKAEMQTKKV